MRATFLKKGKSIIPLVLVFFPHHSSQMSTCVPASKPEMFLLNNTPRYLKKQHPGVDMVAIPVFQLRNRKEYKNPLAFWRGIFLGSISSIHRKLQHHQEGLKGRVQPPPVCEQIHQVSITAWMRYHSCNKTSNDMQQRVEFLAATSGYGCKPGESSSS